MIDDDEVCPVCGKGKLDHGECSNIDCCYCGNLVFCNHICIEDYDDEE